MKELVKMIELFGRSTGKDNKQVMSDLLQYIVGSFDPEETPIPNWNYTKSQNEQFHRMLLKWLDVMNEETRRREWFDPWGELFMALTPKGGARGQFFTPDTICDLMADTVSTDTQPDHDCGAFGMRVTIGDPTCGSGRNLLAAHAKFVKDNAKKPYLIAEDIDIDCCRMTAVNMMCHGCFGEVICHDTLCDPKGVRVGFLINEGMYPFPGLPTIRMRKTPEWFVSLR